MDGAKSEIRKVGREAFGDKAARKLIEAYPERASRVEIPAELPPDMDAPEDYESALAFFERDGA